MTKRVERPGVRAGYDLWATSYDATPNPLVALDRKHTLDFLKPAAGERVLDAGCGTGAHLRAIAATGALSAGLDFSFGMLRVAKTAVPGSHLAQADLNRAFPVKRQSFDALLCSLVSEHLNDLQTFFGEARAVLKSGGRLVFSAFHPEIARAGVEANFEHEGTEYRLGAEPYTIDDYMGRMEDAGFRDLRASEFSVDDTMRATIPKAEKYRDKPLLLVIEAERG
jgi:SAM-dependent methyltransferase